MGGRIAKAILCALLLSAAAQDGPAQDRPAQDRPSPDGAAQGRMAQASQPERAGRSTGLVPSFFPAARFVLPMEHPQGDPLRVELHVSRDRGQTWQLMDVIRYRDRRPSADHFTVQAPEDGEYWFSVRTLFSTHADPRGALTPAVYVIVDTHQPELTMRVLAGGAGELVAQWEIADPHLDPSTLKIEYQTSERGVWRPVALKQALDAKSTETKGESIWWPKSAAEGVTVRAEVMDHAGNRRQAQQWHPLSKIASKPNRLATSDSLSQQAVGEPGGIRWPAERQSSQPAIAKTLERGTGQSRHSVADGQPQRLGDVAQGADRSPVPPHTETGERRVNERDLSRDGWTSRDPSAVASEPNHGPVHPPVAYRPNVKASTISRTLLKQLPNGDLPSMTNSRQFEFDYDVDAVGRDGVSRVELYRTTDGGRSWTLDRKLNSPDTSQPLQVTVDGEGVYGYRVVVVAVSGLASRRPRPGDQADLWIGVDTTEPIVRLTGAVYGKNEDAGRLAIRWEADDALFGDRPVTIRFSETAEGPWVTIASGLPNSGEYLWAADPRTPEEIFLRIEVRDAAGNKAADQLERAIKVEGLIPRGRIRGFRPVR